MTHVKICGVQSVPDALAASEAGADFVGVVFAQSPRRVSIETAREIADALGGTCYVESRAGEVGVRQLERLLEAKRPALVGVFDAQTAGEIESAVEGAGIDVVQLHGCDLPWFASRLPVIKAVETAAEVKADNDSSMLLLDGSRGRGRRGDWESLAGPSCRRPFILAGGLTPENVGDVVRRLHPWGVDVSSGVETDGRKDAAKMREFVRAAKGAIDDVSSG